MTHEQITADFQIKSEFLASIDAKESKPVGSCMLDHEERQIFYEIESIDGLDTAKLFLIEECGISANDADELTDRNII